MKVIREEDVSKFEEERIIPKEKPILEDENIPNESLERHVSEKSPLTTICEVTEYLFLSAAPAVKPERLCELGVTCVVNAARELPDTPLPQDRQIAYFKINVCDTRSTDILSHMDFVADTIEEVRSAGGKTLVHCVAGISRSATLCLAYLIKYKKMSLRKAFTYLKSRRSSIRPNPAFFSQLIEFERRNFNATTVNMVYNQAAGAIIPDVYEEEYQNMLWYQQHYRHIFGRH